MLDCSVIIITLSIFSVLCEDQTSLDIHYIADYLSQLGYIKNTEEISTINETSLSPYITLFQEYYNLPNDGTLNNETLNLMKTPRCGNKDLGEFRARSRWNKRVLTWNFIRGAEEVIEITQQAFHIWQKHSNLKFSHNQYNPDILISFRWNQHRCIKNSSFFCDKSFDGRGGILGHAYYPYPHRSFVEIHIDYEENWYYKNDTNLPYDQISLLSVLTHEIGHALGLGHSSLNDSIMFPFYIIDNGRNIDLGVDDINGIQHLYGLPAPLPPIQPSPPPQPSSTTTTATTTTTTTATMKPSYEKTNETQLHLCEMNAIPQLIVINNHLYILHNDLFWISNLRENTIGKSQSITKWLKFLPQNFSNISAVYQRPMGEVVLVINNYIYMFDIKTLRLHSGYPIPISKIDLDATVKINGIVNTYTGRTYIFYNGEYYIELDECSFSVKKHGYVHEDFPGLPKNIDSAFRYTNGIIYFFKDNYVYQYNEFKNILEKTEKFDLSIFGINCLNKKFVNTLIDMLAKLL